mmetsp:Transcript_1547/g.2356  ORF Transcript_1547/g.2356 Transcript_1547/m.2356 type:complete len:132 (-) Transcript_1547:271-666(-)
MQVLQFVRGFATRLGRADRGLYAGKTKLFGNNVSHSNRRTRRFWNPNVQFKKLYSEILDSSLKIHVTTYALKCIDRAGGLDNYLLKTSDQKIGSEFGIGLKRRLQEAILSQPSEAKTAISSDSNLSTASSS